MTNNAANNQIKSNPDRDAGASHRNRPQDVSPGDRTVGRKAAGTKAMSKAEINTLPLRRYDGPVSVVKTQSDLKRAIRKLKGEKVLGFDTETRPSFKKGQSYQPTLIQLAARDEVFLFHLGHCPLNDGLLGILENPAILKAGVATVRDLAELRALQPFEPGGFVNLEDKARALGFQNQGLRGMVAALLGFRISKRAQTSNWSRKELTPAQITYAATDAWVSRELYAALDRLEHETAAKQRVEGSG